MLDRVGSGVPAIFMHLQKTAGSSLVHLAKHHYGSEAVTSHGDFALLPDDQKIFISGHFGFSHVLPRLENRFSFTFLRDPIDRVISLYNFCRKRDPDQFPIYAAASAYDFAGFVTFCSERPPETSSNDTKIVYETVWNNMTWQLAHGWNAMVNDPNRTTILDFSQDELLAKAMTNLERLDFVGLDTSYEADARLVVARL